MDSREKRSQQCEKDALSYEVGCQQKTVELVYGFTVPDICYVLKSSKVLFFHLVNPFLSKACDTSVGQKKKTRRHCTIISVWD